MSVKLGLRFCSKIVACGLLLGSLLPVSVQAQTLTWKQLLGTSGRDFSNGVATGRGNVYISGVTTGSLAGTNNAGIDAWVARYEGSGVLVWKRQLGLFGPDVNSNNVASDSVGNVYIAGDTTGSLAASNQGRSDAWVAKYDFSGALLWKRQLGTSGDDRSFDVTSDSVGNVYITGDTTGSLAGRNQGSNDAWVAKYNSSGTLLWKRQLDNELSYGVATDSNGNAYIAGITNIRGTGDAWVAKYNSTGTLLWERRLGTRSSSANGVATDSNGNVYIAGSTLAFVGQVNPGAADAFVVKYNSAGSLEWKRQLGTSNYDAAFGLATDSLGDVYISGETSGSLGGTFMGGESDAWVAKYTTTGKLVWKQQFGTSSYDSSTDVATDGMGVYLSGRTFGSLGGASQGLGDAFVVKYTQ